MDAIGDRPWIASAGPPQFVVKNCKYRRKTPVKGFSVACVVPCEALVLCTPVVHVQFAIDVSTFKAHRRHDWSVPMNYACALSFVIACPRQSALSASTLWPPDSDCQ